MRSVINSRCLMNNDRRSDVMTPAQRSRCMSRIRNKNTKPELALRKELWASGLRYRIHCSLPGRPDIVFPGKRVAVFVDGCFWHGCPEHGVSPKTNAAFWKKKIRGNIERDTMITSKLKGLGWTVLRFWEHEINGDLKGVLDRIKSVLRTCVET